MSDLRDNIAAQLWQFIHEETVALVRNFLVGLDEKQQNRFLNLVAQGSRPLVAEAMGLADAGDLLDEIQVLRDVIADDVYVEYRAGYNAEYGDYRGFGDDSWIGEMDDLFATYRRFSALKDELRKAIEGPDARRGRRVNPGAVKSSDGKPRRNGYGHHGGVGRGIQSRF